MMTSCEYKSIEQIGRLMLTVAVLNIMPHKELLIGLAAAKDQSLLESYYSAFSIRARMNLFV